jgi:hypothetical protein
VCTPYSGFFSYQLSYRLCETLDRASVQNRQTMSGHPEQAPDRGGRRPTILLCCTTRRRGHALARMPPLTSTSLSLGVFARSPSERWQPRISTKSPHRMGVPSSTTYKSAQSATAARRGLRTRLCAPLQIESDLYSRPPTRLVRIADPLAGLRSGGGCFR